MNALYLRDKLTQVLGFWNPFCAKEGFDVEFISPEEWAERFNRIKPEDRIAALLHPAENVTAFTDPSNPKNLICCHSEVR